MLSEFVRCEHSHWNTRVQNWSLVQFTCSEQTFTADALGDFIASVLFNKVVA